MLALAFWAGVEHRADAHTKLLRTATGAEAITLTFSTPVPARLTEIDVLAARGGRIEPGAPRSVAGRPTSVTLPIRGRLRDGKYFVTWSTADDDGHVVSGVFDFTLRGTPAAPAVAARVAPAAPAVTAPAAPRAPAATTAALSLARIAQDWALALAFGLVVFLALVWRRIDAPADPRVTTRLRRLLMAAATVGAASATAAVLLQSAVLARGAPWDGLALVRLPEVVTTRAGACWALVAVSWLGVLAVGRRPGGAVLAGLAALLVLTPPLRGHGGDASFALVVVHVAAVGAWIGGLVALLATMHLLRVGECAALVERFGAVALPCAVAVVATGALQAIGALDGVGQLATTGYGRLLALKLALMAVLIALGARSRRSLAGRLRPADGRDATATLRATAGAEVALAGIALGAAGMLAGMAPPG